MSDKNNREYKINIDPRILELLGPSLYTNIYYVLAELIANAYDANASNVYIIEKKDSIIVEDDGSGMSYKSHDTERYLDVAVETRVTDADTYVSDSKTRKRMGRKGVGKLAALSVSENVLINTRKNKEESGFVLSRHINPDYKLKPLYGDEIKFERLDKNTSGTSIVMTKPEYGLHKTVSAIKNNLIKIFPLINSNFKIHIESEGGSAIITSFDKEMIEGLGGLIVLDKKYHGLSKYFKSDFKEKNKIKELLKLENAKVVPLILKRKNGVEQEYNLAIKGWIGFYRTTRDRKKDQSDFPDNFISLLSNGKLGEYNILPTVGKNKLTEVYVVGQLHVDLFEETNLPDMALSNRQGYKTDDPRYQALISYVRKDLLPSIVNMRVAFASWKSEEKNRIKEEQRKKGEAILRKKVEEYKFYVSKNASEKIAAKFGSKIPGGVNQIIAGAMNGAFPLMGLKSKVDSNKKKILISHFRGDKVLCDVIEKMLIFNNIPEEDIVYTSSDNVDSGIPAGDHIFGYLRDYFVDSYSDKKIFVIYVTSEDMAREWNPVTEVGAGWITESKHQIFTINNYQPKRPLDIDLQWHESKKESDTVILTKRQFDEFIKKILYITTYIGYIPKDRKANIEELTRYVQVD